MRSLQIRHVFNVGRPVHGRRVILFVAPGSGQFAVVAARRVGGAVERNRARRVLRAGWREIAPQVGDDDVVLVAREGIRGAKTQDLVAEMTELLTQKGLART